MINRFLLPVRKRFSYFIPYFAKRNISNTYERLKYGVRIERGAYVRNSTFESNCAVGEDTRIFDSSFGTHSYVGSGSELNNVKVGRYCSISGKVRTKMGKHPTDTFVSTSPIFYSRNTPTGPGFVDENRFKEHDFVDSECKYFVDIGNDVWVGYNVMIADGVKISDGAIIAANSVIRNDVPPYSIVGGTPAKYIRARFSDEEIEFLIRLKWWDRPEEWIKDNALYFNNIKSLMDRNIEEENCSD